MQNTDNKYRKFRYYEGVCSAGDFVKEIAKVLSMGVRENSTLTLKDENGQAYDIQKPFFGKNWDIVYPQPSEEYINKIREENSNALLDFSREKYDSSYAGLSHENKTYKLLDQINQITNNVVLKTTTTEKIIAEEAKDDLSVSGDTDQASKTMYVQIYKPKYITNPEEYPLDAELHGLIPQVITKEMYKEARNSSLSKEYDLSQKGITTVSSEEYTIESISPLYEESDLFDGDSAKFKGLTTVLGNSNLFSSVGVPGIFNGPRPTDSTPIECDLEKVDLNAIKQTQKTLYEFLMSICNSTTSFSDAEYDSLDRMHIKVVRVKEEINADQTVSNLYEVQLSYVKKVNVYTIQSGTVVNINELFGITKALEAIKPELYSEGRYIPLDNRWYTGSSDTGFTFTKKIRFCLDKVIEDDVDENSDVTNTLHGTIVIRFKTDKTDFEYTGLESLKVTSSVSLDNNHCCIIRMFDNPNSEFSGPEPNITDNDGNITITNSHSSPWSKLSWYQDFEEIMLDEIDEDVSTSSVTDGTLLVPLQTPGLTADTRLSYWINTNNDRTILVVMGNPALDYERDRHLISSCYIGQIESFENSINDVSGNFALYTSSSTVPCNTIMQSNLTNHHLKYSEYDKLFDIKESININDIEDEELKNKVQEFIALYDNDAEFSKHKQKKSAISNGQGFMSYYLTLTENQYFNENEIPRYMVVDKNKTTIKVPYSFIDSIELIKGSSDSRANKIAMFIHDAVDISDDDEVYFYFGYYEEKFTITSGVTRDVFGNVLDIEHIKDYGANTSDGTTSVSMYHTRSKAFYQKHHFLFATTEEYMSKSQYGKSAYTGEYYADRIKITHGNDGPRGILSDILVIDNSSLYPKDELVINKDFEKNPDELEETFAYFPITAPYSPLSDSPNARYGIAIKKSEKEPSYRDPDKILSISTNELDTIMNDNRIVSSPISLLGNTEAGGTIYWDVVPNTEWIADDNGTRITKTIGNSVKEYKVRNLSENKNAGIITITGFEAEPSTPQTVNPTKLTGTITKTATKTNDFVSHVKIELDGGSSFSTSTANTEVKIFYGYSDREITSINGSPVIAKVFDTDIEINSTTHETLKKEYVYSDITLNGSIITIDPYHEINANALTNISIYNAEPDKYINLLVTEKNSDSDERKIVQFLSLPLTSKDDDEHSEDPLFDLLQYTCNIKVIVEDVNDINTTGIVERNQISQNKDYYYNEYKKEFKIQTKGLGAEYVANISYENEEILNKTATISSNYLTVAANDVINDMTIYITHIQS